MSYRGLVAVVALAGLPALAGAADAVNIRVSRAAARCFEPAARTFSRLHLVPVALEVGDPSVVAGADVVVGGDEDLTRVLEGAQGYPATAVDIGYVAPSSGAFDRRPRILTAVEVASPVRSTGAALLLAYLSSDAAQQDFARCSGQLTPAAARGDVRTTAAGGAAVFASAIADSWLPACSATRNAYNEPREALGAPDAANLGGKDNYRGMISLGQGGYVTLDMGQTVANRPGADVRVYQATAGEPITLYAGDAPNGPFTLIGFRRYCGNRSAPGTFSNFCDFDLAEAGLSSARYLRVEDGEIYPCLRGSTLSEGADLDAVELLNP